MTSSVRSYKYKLQRYLKYDKIVNKKRYQAFKREFQNKKKTLQLILQAKLNSYAYIITQQQGMQYTNNSSTYQPYESVGSLSMVNPSQISQQQNLDYLENLCGFVDQMNLNPLWYESESAVNKVKVLQIYQLAINYSKNLSQNYQTEIQRLEKKNKLAREDNEQRQKNIRTHKEKVDKMKDLYKVKKHKLYKGIYTNLKQKIKDQQRHHRRDRYQSEYDSSQPQVVYYPVQQPPPGAFYPQGQQNGLYLDPHQGNPLPAHYPPPGYQHYNQQGQYPNPQPMHPQEAIGRNLHQFFNKNAQQTNLIGTKKTHDSFIVDPNNQRVQDEDYEFDDNESQIIKKHNVQSISKSKSGKQNQSSVKKSQKKSSKIQVSKKDDDIFDLPNLGQNSRKSINTKGLIEQPPRADSSLQQQHYDSIANMNISKQSGINKGKLPFQSKVINKNKGSQTSIKEFAPDSIKQEKEELGYSLPGASNIKKEKSKQEEKQQSHLLSPHAQSNKGNTLNISNDGLGVSNMKTSKYSKQNSEEARKIFKQPLQRSPKQEEGSQRKKSSDDDLGDMELIGVSNKVPTNSKMKKEPSQDYGNIMDSRQISGIVKKNKNKDEEAPAGKIFEKPPIRRSILQSKKIEGSEQGQAQKKSIQEPEVVSLSVQKKKIEVQIKGNKGNKPIIRKAYDQHQEYGNIYESNIGSKSSKEDKSNQKLFKEELIKKNKEGDDKIEEEKSEENSYADDFDDIDDNLLQSRQPKTSQEIFDINLNPDDLLKSHQPKEGKKVDFKVQNSNNLHIKQSKKEVSSVNIEYASMSTINQKSKYVKLKDEEFIKKNKLDNLVGKTQQSQTLMSASSDPFDFMDSMPANSVIAKRPRLNSQRINKSRIADKKNTISIKNLPSSQDLGGSDANMSINVIHPDRVKEKLLSKQDYKKAKNKEMQQSVQQKIPQVNEDIKNSSLPTSQQDILKSKVSKKITKKTSILDMNKPESREFKGEQVPSKNHKDSQDIVLQLIDENRQVSSIQQMRKRIIGMATNFQKADFTSFDHATFDSKNIQETLKTVCRYNSKDAASIEQLQQHKQTLQKEIKRAKAEIQQKKRKVQLVLKQEHIKLQTPPKLSSPKDNDSLLYSRSHFQERERNSNVNIKKQLANEKDFVQSMEFDGLPLKKESRTESIQSNPYTPSTLINKKGEQPKQENKFLMQNKSNGTKQQDQLIKNAGEGILKYDKDDLLNNEVVKLLNKKTEENEQQYEDDDEWNE